MLDFVRPAGIVQAIGPMSSSRTRSTHASSCVASASTRSKRIEAIAMSRARLLFVLLVFLASFMRAAVASDRDDAELELMLAERRGLDVGAPLRWHYVIEDVPARELASLHAALARIGCSEITVPEMDAENDAGRHEVWADERRAHDVRSYAERLAEVRAIARAHRAHLAFWGVYALERE